MKPPSIAGAYCMLVPILTEVAREHGYALAIHGSMQRDLDLIVVPWVKDACGASELVHALYERVKWTSPHTGPRGPVERPHGRLGWSIALDGGAYLDISVMPLAREPESIAAPLPPPPLKAS